MTRLGSNPNCSSVVQRTFFARWKSRRNDPGEDSDHRQKVTGSGSSVTAPPNPQPSPKCWRVDSCVTLLFEACSPLTHLAICVLAESPSPPFTPEAPAPCHLHRRSDWPPHCGPTPFTEHSITWVKTKSAVPLLLPSLRLAASEVGFQLFLREKRGAPFYLVPHRSPMQFRTMRSIGVRMAVGTSREGCIEACSGWGGTHDPGRRAHWFDRGWRTGGPRKLPSATLGCYVTNDSSGLPLHDVAE